MSMKVNTKTQKKRLAVTVVIYDISSSWASNHGANKQELHSATYSPVEMKSPKADQTKSTSLNKNDYHYTSL